MIISRRVLLLVLTAVFALSICGTAGAQTKKTFTVVIDPGHGGSQPGATSGKLLEKTLNLNIALALGKLISDNMPDVEVIYTRTGDRDVGLAERGAIANRAGADLFFSIHMNSHRNLSANGSSTWVLGISKNEENLKEAMRENEVIRYEDGYTETYEGFDPASAESYIIFNLMQYAHFDRSLALARIVQKHYSRNTPLRDRGAAQGPFVVLWKPAMPSVLTEVAFMSNDADRGYLTSEAGQQKIAHSLYDAFREYRELVQSNAAGKPAVAEKPAATPASQPASQPAARPAAAPITPPDAGFYVQLMAARTKVATDDRLFGEYRGRVAEKAIDGWYKYYIGPYTSQDEAARARDNARKQKNFKDAFIVTQN